MVGIFLSALNTPLKISLVLGSPQAGDQSVAVQVTLSLSQRWVLQGCAIFTCIANLLAAKGLDLACVE